MIFRQKQYKFKRTFRYFVHVRKTNLKTVQLEMRMANKEMCLANPFKR